MSDAASVYWADLANDMQDPEFLRQFVLESIRISTVDSIMNTIDEAREAAGLSKAGLARTISAEPAVVRRLLGGASRSNPTLGTLSELAAAVGYRVTLEPVKASAAPVAQALRTGSTGDAAELARAVSEMAA